jgi:hypothetical protein
LNHAYPAPNLPLELLADEVIAAASLDSGNAMIFRNS